jgi:hypothetical protein
MKKLLVFAILLISSVFVLNGCGNNQGQTVPPQVSGPPTVSMVANPSTINQGESTTLTWTSIDSTSVEITGIPDATSPSGVIVVYPTETTEYSIRALGPVGISAPVKLTVTVIPIVMPPPPPPPPTVGVVTMTINWTLPTTYSDGTAIEQAALDNLVTQIYMKTTSDSFLSTDIPIATSVYAATSITVSDVTVTLGTTYYFSAKIHVAPDGTWSEFAPTVPHVWTSP